ncbi:hypothetical protein GGH19_002287 [Coemansia sp. RSA 1807]|nr:hypothetical protein J3F82_001417 [Coemansia sp. RSA 637]KAJ2221276.1 hypothetical protein IW143_001885 [Coemansia sp. RSA 520]KAJ2532747.1 hypothetical protein GGH20_001000 [Coemansia sp. RSA 1937]KAJ2536626.1 hypothetical protein IWW43_000699 [Coemansia sp. RSA 1935]KAJ2576298.1 hypothetical protein GGH19_002287 [Coemansia sp. RSA 1807]KAJ2726478.1 hypothetical protein H4S00_001855 [Coemansia sp. D1744]
MNDPTFDNTSLLDECQVPKSEHLCQESPDSGASTSTHVPNTEFPDTLNGHTVLFDCCRKVLSQRTDDEANAELQQTLRRFGKLVKSAQNLMMAELADAERIMAIKKQALYRDQTKLQQCRDNLDTALAKVAMEFATAIALDPQFLDTHLCLKAWLKHMVSTRAEAINAELKVNESKEMLELAGSRCNAAKTRVDVDQRIKYVEAKIGSNIEIGD